MTESTDTRAITPLAIDLAAERLLGAIEAGCELRSEFRGQIEGAFGAAFALLASEPGLISPLTSRDVSRSMRAQQRRFWATCAARLRDAARRAGVRNEDQPPFIETFLLAAVQFEVSRAAFEDQATLLPVRTRGLCDFIGAYYS